MTIDIASRISFVGAAQQWMQSRPLLAPATRVAYAGEINRFAEYLASLGIRDIGDVSSAWWESYLRVLTAGRSGVATRRTESLRSTSALQAGRITRAFLRYCWSQGFIGWLPDLANRSCVSVSQTDQPPTIPPVLVEVLLDMPSPTDREHQARIRLAASLAFWCSMTPVEISAARVSDLHLLAEGACEVFIRGRHSVARAPNTMLRLLRSYEELRQANVGGTSKADVPLVSQLASYEALTATSVWRILRYWSPPGGSERKASHALGAKALRDAFASVAGEPVATAATALKSQTGRSRLNLDRCLIGPPTAMSDTLDSAMQTLTRLRAESSAHRTGRRLARLSK